jgi:hypothetical protein
MRGMGMGTGMILGALIGRNHKKNKDPYHIDQPGGWLFYVGIPLAGIFVALNTLANAMDMEYPPQPIWLEPLFILLGTAFLVYLVVIVRKSIREDIKKQMELKKKQRIEQIRNILK